MGQRHAFRFAGGAGGEEQHGFVVAELFADAEQRRDDGGGEDFAEDGPGDDLLFERGQGALDEDQIAVRWPGEGGELANEGIGGDVAVEPSLAHSGADGFVAGGEVEIDGGLAGEDRGEVGDQAGFSGRQDDADARVVGGFAEVFREDQGGAEDAVEADRRVVRAVVQLVAAVLFQALEQGGGEG